MPARRAFLASRSVIARLLESPFVKRTATNATPGRLSLHNDRKTQTCNFLLLPFLVSPNQKTLEGIKSTDFRGIPVSKPRSVTCHMKSHTTCHPTEKNAPRLNSRQTGRYSIYPPHRNERRPWPWCFLYSEMATTWPRFEPTTSRSQVQHRTVTQPSHLLPITSPSNAIFELEINAFATGHCPEPRWAMKTLQRSRRPPSEINRVAKVESNFLPLAVAVLT